MATSDAELVQKIIFLLSEMTRIACEKEKETEASKPSFIISTEPNSSPNEIVDENSWEIVSPKSCIKK